MQHIIERMRNYQTVSWDNIPDIGLYKDQVLTYIERVYAPLYGENADKLLSPSMINNYVKMGVIARPDGKKYGREQLAMLTMLVVLKQATSIEDFARMIRAEGDSLQETYEAFCASYADSLRSYADMLEEANASAMRLAIGASVSALASENMLLATESRD